MEQCQYELRLLGTILIPTFEKILSADPADLPDVLPNIGKIKTLWLMNFYEHSLDLLRDLHTMFHNYLVNINTFLNLCDEEDEEVTKIEAEKRETVYYSVMELLNKFESSVTNANGNVYMFRDQLVTLTKKIVSHVCFNVTHNLQPF